jgi:hypothetical protein
MFSSRCFGPFRPCIALIIVKDGRILVRIFGFRLVFPLVFVGEGLLVLEDGKFLSILNVVCYCGLY